MAKADLIKQAQAFGINTEGLTVDQLQGAIANFLSAKKDEYEVNVEEAKNKLETLPADAAQEDKDKAQQDYDAAVSTLDAFTESLKTPEKTEGEDPVEKNGEDPVVSQEPTKTPQAKSSKGNTKEPAKPAKASQAKTEKSIEINGATYAFTKKAPERINFLGKNKSQEEWLQDPDAMELLALGNSMYVKQLKK